MDQQDSQSQDSLAQQLLCQWFVNEWKAGKRPDLEVVLKEVSPERRHSVMAQLLRAEVARRRECGEDPKPDEYIERFPSDQVTISAAFDALSETWVESNPPAGERAVANPPVMSIGNRLGKYEVTAVLGEGGMGVVYSARDTVIRRDVAIKQLSHRQAGKDGSMVRLLQEARAAGSLHHPNIVLIFDVIEQNDTVYLVMEKVSGTSLSDVLLKANLNRMDWRAATAAIIDCCEALQAAHAQGMIHRDIKPQNIMLTAAGRAKLLDFGLAKFSHADETALTAVGTILGTPDFMSPEQFRGGSLDARCDLYSLGATYFTLLTGRVPFPTSGNHLKTMYAHCHEPVPSVTSLAPDAPSGCEAVVRKAMEKNPADRFQTATEFLQELKSLLESDGKLTTLSARSASPVRWTIVITGAIAVLSFLAIGIAWSLYKPGADSNSEQNEKKLDLGSIAPHATSQGVTADTIHFGTSTAYSGPNAELGQHMVQGIRTCFAAVNESGGIYGRKLQLHVLDDGYDPAKSLVNTRELFEDRHVFAIVGNVGAATAAQTLPYTLQHKHLFFAPLTGARVVRSDPPDRYVFHYRASFAEEMAALVRYFVELRQIPPERIAVFSQNDSYGDDCFSGVVRAMRAYRIREEDILRASYERNTVDVELAVSKVLEHQDKISAVIMAGTYKPTATFVREVRKQSPGVLFGTVSFVNSKSLADQFQETGPESGEGLIVTQVVPHPLSNSTGVLRYRDLLKKHFPEFQPGSVSLEGFIAAECLVEGLRQAGPDLTTEKLVDALESIDGLDLGIGPIIRFSPSRHQASDKVWATRLLKTGEFEIVTLD